MPNSREQKAKLNIIISLLSQMVVLICGLIVPRVLIKTFGSEAYGATSSITQFLAYIALLEGGISGVARATLYGPLANNDVIKISQIVCQIQKFFRKVGYVFCVYVIVLAMFFKKISGTEEFTWLWLFLLVLVISISTFAQYFIGITYSVLIQASQRTYITQAISIIATILNTILILILIKCNLSLIVVKLVSSCVFALKPIAMYLYVRKRFTLVKCKHSGEDMLKQRWTALGQHLAYFLHSNTDVAILTVFVGLKSVAVYAIYSMVVSNIQTVITSFSAGMEALFGDMLAKNEIKKLNQTFGRYETMISIITSILLSTAIVLIIPFVSLYTRDVNDVNYIQPVFAVILVVASIFYCLRQPYHSLITAAGHFKQTRIAAYGEAILNIVISILLVHVLGLIGVAVGTMISVGFRFVFYVVYINQYILKRSVGLFVKREVVNLITITLSVVCGLYVVDSSQIQSYFTWGINGIIIVVIGSLITLCANYLFFADDTRFFVRKTIVKRR